jgi:Cft2 family RNA processing exonuclease
MANRPQVCESPEAIRMELNFYGATGEVTGSCHILRIGGREVLLGCGMIQGGKPQTWLVHGEPEGATGLRDALRQRGVPAEVARSGQRPDLAQAA